MSGFGLGNPIAIAPFEIQGETDDSEGRGLAEVLEALEQCGLSGSDVDALRQAVGEKLGPGSSKSDVLGFFDTVHRIRARARRELKPPTRDWYVVGELLGRINGLCLIPDADVESDAMALESITDILDAPATLIEQLRRFSQEIRAIENIRPFFERTQTLAKVMFDVLDTLPS